MLQFQHKNHKLQNIFLRFFYFQKDTDDRVRERGKLTFNMKISNCLNK